MFRLTQEEVTSRKLSPMQHLKVSHGATKFINIVLKAFAEPLEPIVPFIIVRLNLANNGCELFWVN
jgi:hypothetical protein